MNNTGIKMATDREMTDHFERVVRKVKRAMRYDGSMKTAEILAALVVRWVESGEWERLKALPPEERKIGLSVRNFILDQIDSLHAKAKKGSVAIDQAIVASDEDLEATVEDIMMRLWLRARIEELKQGTVDRRFLLPLVEPNEVGQVLHHHCEGMTQREIVNALAMKLSTVNKRLQDGTSYLITLRSIEEKTS